MAAASEKHLLIVEDSPDLQHLLGQLLRKEGYTLSTALNGQEALNLLRTMSTPPNAILLDIMMPVMDGITFRDEQRKDPRLADIPVVVMTADSHPESKAARLQVQDFIRKPVDVPQLLAIIERVCG